MSQYQTFNIPLPESISDLAELFDGLKVGLDLLIENTIIGAKLAKLQASGANLQLTALKKGLDAIIEEIEKLKGGTFSGILAHPYVHGIRAGYEKVTDTMTLKPESALKQISEAFDDEGDSIAPDKFNNYGGLIIVGSAVGVEEFMSICGAIGKFFSRQDLLDLKAQIEERWKEKKEGEKVIVKLSSGIDFVGISQEEIFPEYASLLEDIKGFVEGIKSATISASSSIDDLLVVLLKKLSDAESILKKIKALVDAFSIELSGGNIRYKIFEREKHTADTIKKELLVGMPEDWKISEYSVVLGLFAGSKSIELIFDLLSLD